MPSALPDGSEWRFPNRATPLGSPTYYAVRFSPPGQRERNGLLIAWYDLIREIAERPHDPGVARLKLDWWREEIAGIRDGGTRHPLTAALHAAGVDHRALTPMRTIIDAAEDDIRLPYIADQAHFVRACRGSLGAFFELLAAIDAGGGREHCQRAGAYCSAVERLRHAAAAPRRLPEELRPAALRGLSDDERRRRCEALLDGLRVDARGTARALPDLARRLTALASAMHRKIRRRGYPVADVLIDRAPIAHLWTAWRCR